YAAAAFFDTGLGDQDWSGAQWIQRQPAAGNDASNQWTAARKVLHVSGGSRVVRARAYVAAMGDWQLNVAGRQVQRSSSYAYPGIDTLTYRNSDAGDRVEYYDATAEMTGWDTAGYADGDWAAATVIGTHPRPEQDNCSSYEGGSAPCAFTHLSALQAHLAQ